MTQLVRTRVELAAALRRLPRPVGLVPTMGALHEGHVANIRAAQAQNRSVVVTIFVNPMQFDRPSDLDRYPRPLERDVQMCGDLGVALVWAPEVGAVYQYGPPQIRVTAGALGDQLEGPRRPGHFDGVLTVVTKLFGAIRPERAYFGEKDFQQLTLIRRLVLDLDLGVQIVAVPTVRETDGLALSSRNVFLSPRERHDALALPSALHAGQAAAGDADAVMTAARAVLEGARGVDVEYLELRGPELGHVPAVGPARLLVAARVGATRLIDNLSIELSR